MSDESPLAELIRTAKEVANELYYLRTDNSWRVPNGVMVRFIAATERVQKEHPEAT